MELLLQVAASIMIVTPLLTFGKKLNQDVSSYFFVGLVAILHNLDLYQTSPFGIRFDHYAHFLGGFTVAIVVDRIFKEDLPRVKRFVLLTVSALGVGAVVEIAQWVDAFLVPTFEMFRADEMSNCMADMVCNGLGGITMGIISLFKKRPNK
jgi:VanZ family protein